MKHTKGEWKAINKPSAGWEIVAPVGAHDFIEYSSVSDNFEAPIFKTIVYEPWHQFPQQKWKEMQEANAKLIAASPIMYNYIVQKAHEGCKDAKLILATLETN